VLNDGPGDLVPALPHMVHIRAYRALMDIPAEVGEPAPWGMNPRTGKPYRVSPEERAAIGAKLSAARTAAAQRRRGEAPTPPVPGAGDGDGDEPTPIDRDGEDREPGAARRHRHRRFTRKPRPAPADVPPFRAGPIAKGINKLYARAGKIVRVVRPDIGEAIIACTRKESDDDLTVGEAWEEVAKINPRWRGILLKLVTGGAWGQVFAAHAPIALAILMMDSIRSKVPFPDLVDAFLDTDRPGGGAGMPTGADIEDMMRMATQMMGPILAQRGGANPSRTVVDSPTLVMPVVDGEVAA
jgi:hypothetical protein